MAAVCMRRLHQCRRCGKDGCSKEEFKISNDQSICFHCWGSHEVGALHCKRRNREGEVEQTQVKVKCLLQKQSRELRAEKGTERKRTGWRWNRGKEQGRGDKEIINMDRRRLLAFIAIVINCTSTI